MNCCGRELNTIELQVAGEPFVLYRCAECDSSHWTRHGETVDADAVTTAMRRETERASAGRASRRV